MYSRGSSSHHKFREFLRIRGFFGHRPPPPEDRGAAEPKKEEKPAKGRLPRKAYLARYVRSLREQRGSLILIMVLTVLLVLLRAALPWASKFIIDSVLPKKSFSLLAWTCGGLLVIGLTLTVTSLFSDYLSQRVLGGYVTAIKRRMMRHLQRMPLHRLQELKVGGIVTRLQSDSESMANLLNSGLLMPFNALIMLCVGVGSLFALDWRVTVSCLGFCLLVLGLAYVMFHILRPVQRAMREEVAVIGGHLTETFSGIQVVRIFGREHAESHGYAKETHLLWRKYLHTNTINLVVHRAIWTVFWLVQVTIWGVGGYQVLKGRMPIGSLVAFIAFISWIFEPVFMIMHSFSQLQVSMASTERVFDLLDEPSDMLDRPAARPIAGLAREMRFEDVTFDYPGGTRALTGVGLTIPHGKVVALVGPSGAGKSTLINLVMRFYDVTSGAILVDGTDLRDLRLKDYRSLISLVPQEVFLFDGTVRDNITYGRPGAGLAAVESAARTANCHEFIAALAKGYETIVGERGVRLSTGQKQRIALARAILTDPQILILDEATSSLDSESENLIQEALRHIFPGRTTLVIAHRLSTVIDADKIVVVDKGHMVEEGSHEELLARQGRYYELYTRQMAKVERSKQILDWNDENTVAVQPSGQA